eukprot:2302324-Pleurochrysis_carterae.AAC.1
MDGRLHIEIPIQHVPETAACARARWQRLAAWPPQCVRSSLDFETAPSCSLSMTSARASSACEWAHMVLHIKAGNYWRIQDRALQGSFSARMCDQRE